jgi:hypothetical protein
MLRAPITTVHHFSVAPITGAHYFCVAPISTAHNFGSCTNTCCMQFFFVSFLYRANIPRAFHSTRCTMPNFSTPPPRTNTLCAPLTKLSCDNIYPHCACTNKIPLCSANTVHTTCAIIMCVHTARALLCVCTCKRTSIMHVSPQSALARNAKFSVHPHTNIFPCGAKF